MNHLNTANDALDLASFLVKTLYIIATERAFTEKDVKDAIDAISAVAKLGSEFTVESDDEAEAMREFFNHLSDAAKNVIDILENGDRQ